MAWFGRCTWLEYGETGLHAAAFKILPLDVDGVAILCGSIASSFDSAIT
jgi:hypothetical protein